MAVPSSPGTLCMVHKNLPIHKPNTRRNSCISRNSLPLHLKKLPPTHSVILLQIRVSVENRKFSVVFYIVTLKIILLHHFRLRLSICRHYSKNFNPRTQRPCCLQLLVFLQAKESLTIAPFWHRRAQVCPKSCCHHEFNTCH